MDFLKKLTQLASALSLVALGTGCSITIATDLDGDGVEEPGDACIRTLPGDPVDVNGCSTADNDGDGVLNDMDMCPATPGPLANGCPDVAGDQDGDGIIDSVDACPTVFGDGTDGCPLPADQDGDGIVDSLDVCPTVFGDGPDGCPLAADQDGDGIVDSLDACPTVFGDGPDGCPLVEGLGTLDGMWLINGVAASAALCNETGISNVRFNVNTADTLGDASWVMPCANRLFDSRVQADEPTIEFNVAYTSFWEALDAGGNVIAMTTPLDLELNNPPQHATVTTPDFIISSANEMTIPLFWQEQGTVNYGTCADAMLTAPADTITIMLYVAGAGAPFASDVDTACTDTLIFHEDDFPALAPGSYELDIAATRASDGTKWGVDACGIEYDGGAQVTEGCDIDIVP